MRRGTSTHDEELIDAIYDAAVAALIEDGEPVVPTRESRALAAELRALLFRGRGARHRPEATEP